MGCSIFGSTVRAAELEQEFDSLVNEVAWRLRSATLTPRHGRTKVWWNTVWRLRNGRPRRVATYRTRYGQWLMLADTRGTEALDYSNLLFVSSEGKIGFAVGQSGTTYYLNVFDSLSGEDGGLEISRWIEGLQFVLDGTTSATDTSHFVVNPF